MKTCTSGSWYSRSSVYYSFTLRTNTPWSGKFLPRHLTNTHTVIFYLFPDLKNKCKTLSLCSRNTTFCATLLPHPKFSLYLSFNYSFFCASPGEIGNNLRLLCPEPQIPAPLGRSSFVFKPVMIWSWVNPSFYVQLKVPDVLIVGTKQGCPCEVIKKPILKKDVQKMFVYPAGTGLTSIHPLS